MKVKIIKGTNQIGGCIVELSTVNTKILIDFGKELDDNSYFDLDGLTIGLPKYDALFISHSHSDHIGLIDRVLDTIPVYVEEKSIKIYNYLCDFTNIKNKKSTVNMFFNQTIEVKDIKVTPFIVDHSSYNSCMLLIEADSKRVLYTGDYRNNGYKGKIFNSTLKDIGTVDLVITEGTSFGRSDKKNVKEIDLTSDAIDIFNNYDNILVLQSSTNIDRITSFYKAAKKTNKNFIEDLFTATLTSNINIKLPNPIYFNDVYVFVSSLYKRQKSKLKYIEPFRKYSNSSMFHNNYVMLVKTSMLCDIVKLKDKGLLENSCLVYSMWAGYKENDDMRRFINKIKEMNIVINDLHTSGHADKKTIDTLINIVNPNKIIFIHTNSKEQTDKYSEKVIRLNDKDEIEV